MKHFLDLKELSSIDIRNIISIAKKLKLDKSKEQFSSLLKNRHLAMIFEKPSTRTRASFQVAISSLGGNSIIINKEETQLSNGESWEDTARVLSRFVDFTMIRANSHKTLTDFAKNSTCHVINGLTDYSHPCQILASILTIEEHLGTIKNKKLSWFGDLNNVLNSYIHASIILNYDLYIASDKKLESHFLNQELGNTLSSVYFASIEDAAKNSDVIITDTWFSMGDKEESNFEAKKKKISLLKKFQVNDRIMELANPNAIFTHCLPAYRGYEVTSSVIDGPQSVVFDEAENRMHVQKAILIWLSKSENELDFLLKN